MKTIHHVVELDATTNAVRQAIATSTGLAGWWTTIVSDFEPAQHSVIAFTFVEGFNPQMEITAIDEEIIEWRCVGGHDAWADNTFRFEISGVDGQAGRARLRFWQHYAIELDDDAYGTYNFNWAYYLQSLLELVTTGTGKPFTVA